MNPNKALWEKGDFTRIAAFMRQSADKLVSSWGEGASWAQDGTAHPAEAQLLRLDTSKARTLLNWHPVLQLDQSLLWIVEWYEAFQAGKDLQSLTRRQIERYEYLLQDDAETCSAPARRMKAAAAPLLSAAEA